MPDVILKDEYDYYAVTAWTQEGAKVLRSLSVWEDTNESPWHNPHVTFRGAIERGDGKRVIRLLHQAGITVEVG